MAATEILPGHFTQLGRFLSQTTGGVSVVQETDQTVTEIVQIITLHVIIWKGEFPDRKVLGDLLA